MRLRDALPRIDPQGAPLPKPPAPPPASIPVLVLTAVGAVPLAVATMLVTLGALHILGLYDPQLGSVRLVIDTAVGMVVVIWGFKQFH